MKLPCILGKYYEPFEKKRASECRLHSATPINEFRLNFYALSNVYTDDINGWVKFAMSRRVEQLVLSTGGYILVDLPYALECDVLKGSPGDSGMSFLSSLCLRDVNVSGELIEFVLSHCHLLEKLLVDGSNHLVNLNVVTDRSSRLKYLSIERCWGMKSLEICATNLVSFEFVCHGRVKVAYNGLPSLVEAAFAGSYCNGNLFRNFQQISCFSTQLVKLSLGLIKVYRKHIKFPAFPNVKHLELS